MLRLRRILGSIIALGALSAASPAMAQDTDGALQLGLTTPIFSYTTGSTTTEFGGDETEIDTSNTTWGLRDEVVGEIGFGLGDSLVLGGILQIGGTSLTQGEGEDEAESSEFGVLIGPKLDFMFSPGQKVRPFLGAAAGLVLASSEAGPVETSVTGFQLIGRAGMRAFLSNGFSLDPALVVSWSTASGEVETGGPSADISVSAVNIGVALGFSGWLD